VIRVKSAGSPGAGALEGPQDNRAKFHEHAVETVGIVSKSRKYRLGAGPIVALSEAESRR
jgi:hypothetical protein